MEHFIVLDNQGRDGRGKTWSLPVENGDRSWTPGTWMLPASVSDRLATSDGQWLFSSILGESGLLGNLGASIYQVELSHVAASHDTEPFRGDTQFRLLQRMNWDASVARSFACDCAEHVLPVVGILYSQVQALHGLLAKSRAFAAQAASRDELDAAVKRAKHMPVVQLDGWANYQACDGPMYLPFFEFACPAAAAALETASEPAWSAAAMAAEKARSGSMGRLTRNRIAKFTQAVKDWGGAGRSYPSWVRGEQMYIECECSCCDLWYEKYSRILDGSQRRIDRRMNALVRIGRGRHSVCYRECLLEKDSRSVNWPRKSLHASAANGSIMQYGLGRCATTSVTCSRIPRAAAGPWSP